MGGYGSGNQGGRPTVEDSLALKLPKLMRAGLVLPNCRLHGPLVWTNSRTRETVASLGFEADLAETHGRLRLHYTTTAMHGAKHVRDYWIALTSLPQPFGGRRWWFVCPERGERVATLYLPSGALTFASRQAHRLGYRSQREIPRDRALSRAIKLRRRLNAEGGTVDDVRRPKGMHHATYAERLEQVWRAEEICEAHCDALLDKLRRLDPQRDPARSRASR